MTYTSQTISGYNASAPSDDGSAVSTNQVKWSFVKTKIGDPVKTLAENINAELLTAFQQLFMGSVTDKASLFTISATNDGGTVFNCTAAFTVTLPAAADAGDGFNVIVLNNSGGSVVIDGNSSETINGTTTVTLTRDLDAYLLVCDGTLWHGFLIQGDLFATNNTFTGDNTCEGDVRMTNDGELTLATGAITVTGSNHIIDTESDASSDDLDTITGGVDGQILILRTANDARNVVVKDGTGNIETADGEDITLELTTEVLTLIYDDGLSKWIVLSNNSRANSGRLLQVKQTIDTTDRSTTSTSMVTSNVSVTFDSNVTSGSTVIVTAQGNFGMSASGEASAQIYKDTGGGDVAISTALMATKINNNSLTHGFAIRFIDTSPGTGQTKYTIYHKTDTGTSYIGRDGGGAISAAEGPTYLTVEEYSG